MKTDCGRGVLNEKKGYGRGRSGGVKGAERTERGK